MWISILQNYYEQNYEMKYNILIKYKITEKTIKKKNGMAWTKKRTYMAL